MATPFFYYFESDPTISPRTEQNVFKYDPNGCICGINWKWEDWKCGSSKEDTKTFVSTVFPAIKKVIFNDPATIVWFSDETKVIVKKADMDDYSKEHALLYAIAKRLYGKVESDGTVSSNGFMSFLKKTVDRGIDQPELARKAAEAKKAKKHVVPANHPKTKKAETTDSSSTNSTTNKYYSKKSNPKKD